MSTPVILPIDRITQALDRELGMRRRVYPRRIAEGKMTEAQAAKETLGMQGTKDTLLAAIDLLEQVNGAPPDRQAIRAFLAKIKPLPPQAELFQ